MSRRLIDLDEYARQLADVQLSCEGDLWYGIEMAFEALYNAPTIDGVPAEKYDDLREAFIDFVCTGVNNPAPYCKNRCEECVDGRGWCTYRRCNGFNPDGKEWCDT